jgi:ATP-dependent DNA helicase MPH1
MFHTALTEIAGNTDGAGKKSGPKGGASSVRNNFEFVKLLRDVEAEMNLIRIGKDGRSKADRHPKMVKTLQLVSLLLETNIPSGADYPQLLDHFQLADEDEKIHGVKNDTRAMVFCSFRDCVLEVVVSAQVPISEILAHRTGHAQPAS